jgi:putative aminopeptidase FrvX
MFWLAGSYRNRGKEEVAKVIIYLLTLLGETKEQVDNMGVHVGCVITYPDEFMILNETNLFVAIDNRMGGFMIAEVARLLHENKIKLPLDCISPIRFREEVGSWCRNDYQNHQAKCCALSLMFVMTPLLQ